MPLDRQMFSDKLQRYMVQFQVSAADVASGTGITLERISAILDSASEPTGDEVLILADFFKCDYKFFISNERLAPFEQTESLFRKYGSELTQEDRWSIQEFLFLCECQDFLLSEQDVDVRQPFGFKKSGSYYKGHGESAAESLRRHLGYDDKSIPANVFKVFREIGIHVFRRQLGQSTISGLFIRHPTAGPCVLVNYNEDIFRQRFTASHEVGHAILDDKDQFVVTFTKWGKNDLSEVRANTFASRFLLPPATLRLLPNPNSWTESQFIDHAVRLMVNAETLAYALAETRQLSEGKVESFKRLRVPAESKTDPELPSSLSRRSRERKEELLKRGLSDAYVGICFDGYERGHISASRLAEMLLTSETELRWFAQLYGRSLSHGD